MMALRTSRRATFKQADAARALRAAVAVGLRPSGYTIAPDGSISVSLDVGGLRSAENSFDQLIGASK